MAALQMVPPASLQPSPPQSRAEFLKSAASRYTSPSESETFQSVVSGSRYVPRLSPVISSDGEHWSQRSVSRLFSHSTGGEEFDEASLSNHMSSVADDCHQRDQRFAWSRRNKVVAFLAAAAVVCVSAVMVDLTWTVLSQSNVTQGVEEVRGATPTEPVDGDAFHQNAPMVKWPAPTKVKPSVNATTSFLSPDTESTIFLDEDEKLPVQFMIITQSLSNATRQKHKREPPQTTPFLPRQRPLQRRRTLARPGVAPLHRHADYEALPNMKVEPVRKPMDQRCGLPFYTYCSKLRHEAYYRHSTHSCVLTIMDDVQVCNHSPNKFATLADCQRSCVHTRMPSAACLEEPLFSWCGRHHVNASWWVFDGRNCRPWNFPAGLCPSPADRNVFRSRRECTRSCSMRDVGLLNRGNGGRTRHCRSPEFGTTCDSNVLRFPYFAHKPPGGEGRLRCAVHIGVYRIRYDSPVCALYLTSFPDFVQTYYMGEY
ncbi:hypothetical protein MTO96_016261 [Rhipicephalus appendiculatus]